MGLFGKLIKTGIDIVSTPIDVVKDIATLGGAVTDEEEPYTIQKLRKIAKDGQSFYDALDE